MANAIRCGAACRGEGWAAQPALKRARLAARPSLQAKGGTPEPHSGPGRRRSCPACRRVARLLNSLLTSLQGGFDRQLREVLGPLYPAALLPSLAAGADAAIQVRRAPAGLVAAKHRASLLRPPPACRTLHRARVHPYPGRRRSCTPRFRVSAPPAPAAWPPLQRRCWAWWTCRTSSGARYRARCGATGRHACAPAPAPACAGHRPGLRARQACLQGWGGLLRRVRQPAAPTARVLLPPPTNIAGAGPALAPAGLASSTLRCSRTWQAVQRQGRSQRASRQGRPPAPAGRQRCVSHPWPRG